MKQSDGSSVALLIVMLRPSTTKNIRKSRRCKKYKLKGRIDKNLRNRSDKDSLVKETDKIGIGFRRKKRKGDEENQLNRSPHNHKNKRKSNHQTPTMIKKTMIISMKIGSHLEKAKV